MVVPSYFARTEARVTCGMMFFSTASWNSGGGGRSTARNRNGVLALLISVPFTVRSVVRYQPQREMHLDQCQNAGVRLPQRQASW